ncbi:hypothetical protein FOA52_001900 [Chlamydomonas sp. UWO 241]|nr:hypothetical protein FOA52_001900 [Chlamydomonas sp. UWO 241]
MAQKPEGDDLDMGMGGDRLISAGDAMDMDIAAGTDAEAGAVAMAFDVKLPLEVGTRVECKWYTNDNQYHTVKLIERRQISGFESDSDYEYYVHYIGYNRRMDEWVQLEQLDLSSVQLELVEEDGTGRKKKKIVDEEHDEEHADFDANALREHEEFTKVKNIEKIELGRHLMDTCVGVFDKACAAPGRSFLRYFSPYPPEYKDCKMLYFCEYSLHYFKRRSQMLRHMAKCRVKHPPGEEIYRNGNVCMFEVDGRKEKTYSQNLCLMAKLFLDHKTLYYDVDLFLFYIMCEIDERGAHIVGYFSKEKCSEDGFNLACILTLPAYQRLGYGKFLISMSYELSKLEGKVGTPERPLSDLGRVSYEAYWTRVLLSFLRNHRGTLSIKDLSEMTAIKVDDILLMLQDRLNLIQYQKGQHVVCAAPSLIDTCLKKAGGPGCPVDPAKIVWTPYNAEREYATYKN